MNEETFFAVFCLSLLGLLTLATIMAITTSGNPDIIDATVCRIAGIEGDACINVIDPTITTKETIRR